MRCRGVALAQHHPGMTRHVERVPAREGRARGRGMSPAWPVATPRVHRGLSATLAHGMGLYPKSAMGAREAWSEDIPVIGARQE